ncbi:MAG: hypothetical protein LC723_14070 [Actinobacteria bacterium]|nr:hypothetical protein [Actinomycetota bacterium]
MTDGSLQLRKASLDYYPDSLLKDVVEPGSFDSAGQLLPANSRQVKVFSRYPDNRVSSVTDEDQNVTTLYYSPEGSITHVDKPATPTGNSYAPAGSVGVTYGYNGLGQVTSILESGHASATRFDYDGFGDRIGAHAPMGGFTRYQYDSAGRLWQTTDPKGKVTERTYDATNNLILLRQPTGTSLSTFVTYTYTDRNEIQTETDPGDQKHKKVYTYDGVGQQKSSYDLFDGVTETATEVTYLSNGAPSKKSSVGQGPSASLQPNIVNYSYDASGNLSSVQKFVDVAETSSVGTWSIGLDSIGELNTLTESVSAFGGSPQTTTAAYTYDTSGRLASSTVDGKFEGFSYSKAGRPTSLTAWVSTTPFTRNYLPDGRPTTYSLPNGSSVATTYDVAGRVASRTAVRSGGSALSSWSSITYDEDNNKRAESVSLGTTSGQLSGASAFGYDTMDRLNSFKYLTDSTAKVYTLDDAGNVTNDGDSTFNYASNRLSTRTTSGVTFTEGYSHKGDQVTETGTPAAVTYTYDAASVPTSVTTSDGSVIRYAYDGLGRLSGRQETAGGVTTTVLFFHDKGSSRLTLEKYPTATVKTRYVLDAAGAPLAQEKDGSLGYYIKGPRGDLAQVIDSTGAIKASYSYDPFGKARSADVSSPSWDSRLRFQMAPVDPKTGAYNLGGRLYNPQINRFVGADNYVAAAANLQLQLDPLTGNRYLYAGANPADLIDDGHRPCRPDECNNDADMGEVCTNSRCGQSDDSSDNPRDHRKGGDAGKKPRSGSTTPAHAPTSGPSSGASAPNTNEGAKQDGKKKPKMSDHLEGSVGFCVIICLGIGVQGGNSYWDDGYGCCFGGANVGAARLSYIARSCRYYMAAGEFGPAAAYGTSGNYSGWSPSSDVSVGGGAGLGIGVARVRNHGFGFGANCG